MESRFSQRLSYLMKERKISGQKIGDAIGKSQKTISRYVNGEIDPSVEMKNAIYRAIADISGVEEDATTEEELDMREMFWELPKDAGEVLLGQEALVVAESNELNLIKTFQMLSFGAKKYYLENFETFHNVESWENEVLNYFHSLSSGKQEELIKHLENFNFDYKVLVNADKISAYMKMISNSEKRPVLIIDKDKLAEYESRQEDLLQEEFENKLFEISSGNSKGEIPGYPWFLSYTPHDWYFLLRVQIFELYDKRTCLWNAELGIETGIKLAYLLDAIK